MFDPYHVSSSTRIRRPISTLAQTGLLGSHFPHLKHTTTQCVVCAPKGDDRRKVSKRTKIPSQGLLLYAVSYFMYITSPTPYNVLTNIK